MPRNNGAVIIDSNLLVLLVVGSASPNYIAAHKRLAEYTVFDFELLTQIVSEFDDIVLLPHILAETSGLARQVAGRARVEVQAALKNLIGTWVEQPVPSVVGAQHKEFAALGLTDAVILHMCAVALDGVEVTLLTSDTELADRAHARGYSVIDYRREFMADG